MNLKLSKSRKINAHLEFLFCLRYFSTCVKNADLLHEKHKLLTYRELYYNI